MIKIKTYQKDIGNHYGDCDRNKPKINGNLNKNNLPLGNLHKDMIISTSGQVKIDNLDSCLTLVSSDFIVF